MEGAAASGVLHPSPGGLTAADAADRLTRDGPDEIRRQPPTGWVTVLARQSTSLLVGTGALLVLQLGVVHLPPLQELFGSSALNSREWLLAAAAGSVVPLVVAEEYLRRRRVPAPPGPAT